MSMEPNVLDTATAPDQGETPLELFGKGYKLGYDAERAASFGTTDPDADVLWEAAAVASGKLYWDPRLSDKDASHRKDMFMSGFVEGAHAKSPSIDA